MRLHLTLALITIIALVISLRAEKGRRFTFADADAMAQKLAAAKYVAKPEVLPPQLKKLTPQQDAGIFSKETARLWRKKGLPFQIDFYPQLNSNPMPHIAPKFNYSDRKGTQVLPYSPNFFNFLNVAVNPPVPLVFTPPLPDNLGYAGFYVRYPDMGIKSNPSSLDGFFSALGGSYLRALAKEQVYGLSARGLAINTGIDNKEEFPAFIEWWLQEPTSNATELVLDALLDGPSVSGAYEFKIRPGAVTSVDIHASLYFRQPVERLGLTPFSSMYLYGENAKDHFGDNVHPEIHDSDGVLMNTGTGDWIWHPLQQTAFKQVYSYLDENPKGFGLLQRDRDFQHYQDLTNKYNVRPSAWVTPHGNWGKGKVELIQPNSNNVNTDNVAMFWWPDQPVQAGDHLDRSYTIDFYMNDADRPPLAYCKQTLVNYPAPPSAPAIPVAATPPPAVPASAGPAPKTAVKPPPPTPPGPAVPAGVTPVQFLVDFAGDGIENIPPNQPPDRDIGGAQPGTIITDTKVEKNGYDNSWRVTFTVVPAKVHVPTDLHCRLIHNNKPITETWSYTWHQ
jgi:glucans biosynthesis protein